MHSDQNNIYLALASITLVLFMALPSLMSFSHAIHGHNERECCSNVALHIHDADLDTEFQKFKLNKQLYVQLEKYELLAPLQLEEKVISYYGFLSWYQGLHFSLRGPPNFPANL